MSGDLSNGIIVIDKPPGMSSARVAAAVKRLLGASKIGHTGTLDPFASGVLVCCLNQATKLARFLLSGTKSYDAVLKLGVSTDTQDATGTAIGQPVAVSIPEQAIRSAFERFRGAIDQHPPVYSALKHKGQPLYKLARSGRPVQKPPRRVQIHALDIDAVTLPLVTFKVRCSAGTYVRTLCHDIGNVLGCGGHLHALRRTECNGYTIEQAVSLADLAAEASSVQRPERIVPMAAALPQMPEWKVDAATTRKIRHGQPLTQADFASAKDGERAGDPDGFIKVVDANRQLISVLKRSSRSRRLEYCCVFPN